MTNHRVAFLFLFSVVLLGAVACGNTDAPTRPVATPVPVVQGGTAVGNPSPTDAATATSSAVPDQPPGAQPTVRPTTAVVSQAEKAVNIMWQMLDRQG